MLLPVDLQAARLQLVKKRPYLSSAVWSLIPVEKSGLETMAVDKFGRLYYDPVVASRWSVDEMAGVIYHEACHILRDHASRMNGLDPRFANIAADAEENDDLLREGVKLPGDPVTPEKLRLPAGLFAEEYYEMLQKNAAEIPQLDAPMPGSGRCGSCATGHQEPWEDGPPSDLNPGIGEAEAELIRRKVAEEILVAAASDSRGNIPGHWKRWAEEKLRPKVDWRRELASAVRRAIADVSGAVDYTYRRPSRRQGRVGNGKVIFPALRRPTPSVAVVVDTSGSISDAMLSQSLAEVSGVLKACGQREGVCVLAVDSAVQACKRVFSPDQVSMAGGGGTDMGVGIQAAENLRPRPQVIVVLTDGLTPWPDNPPRAKVVVGLLGDGDVPEWAKEIKIEGF